MKKIALALVIVLSFIGCNKGRITFYVNDSTTTTVKSVIPINLPYDIPVGQINSTNTQEYQNNNTAPDLIESVNLDKLTVTITSPADEDFSFLKSIHIYIKKSDDSDKVEIAYADNIDPNAHSITLTPTDANLVPYLKESSYKVDTKVEIKKVLTRDVDLRIDLKFKVTAKLLK